MSGAAPPWEIEHHVGSAADFHRRAFPDPPRRAVWWLSVDRPALVLGSAQPDGVVDRPAAAAAHVDVVRRRSGGGAVLLTPTGVTWVDVMIPSGDPLWHQDVNRAFLWLGDACAAALHGLGLASVTVHRGPLRGGRWSDLVCFASLGPGEVQAGGRKVVGIAQRRTRAGARFQCAFLHRWEPQRLTGLLALSPADRAAANHELAMVGGEVSHARREVEQALLSRMPV